MLEQPLDHHQHLVQIERLVEVIVGADLHRADGDRRCAVAGDQNHRDINAVFAQALDQIKPVHTRHLKIHQQQAKAVVALKLFEHRRSAADTRDIIAHVAEQLGQQIDDRRFVVGDQDSPVIFFL